MSVSRKLQKQSYRLCSTLYRRCIDRYYYNYKNIPYAFASIFVGAFAPQSVVGGAAGATVKLALTKGVARGLFSNEAGMGSTPHAHAVAKVNHPVEQGFVAMAGVFIDTFIVLNLTALVILTTKSIPTGKTGAELSQYAFYIIWKRRKYLYCNLHVLLRIFNNHWLVFLRSGQCKILIWT